MIGERHILVFNLESGEMVSQIEATSEGHIFRQTAFENPPVALGNNDTCVAELTDKGVKIWNIETGKLEHEVSVSIVDTSGSIGALDASKEYVAYSESESTDVTVISIHNGNVIQTKFIKLTDEKLICFHSYTATTNEKFVGSSGI